MMGLLSRSDWTRRLRSNSLSDPTTCAFQAVSLDVSTMTVGTGTIGLGLD